MYQIKLKKIKVLDKMDPMARALTLLEPQSRFGDKPVKFQVVCPQNGTSVLKGLICQNTSLFTAVAYCRWYCCTII